MRARPRNLDDNCCSCGCFHIHRLHVNRFAIVCFVYVHEKIFSFLYIIDIQTLFVILRLPLNTSAIYIRTYICILVFIRLFFFFLADKDVMYNIYLYLRQNLFLNYLFKAFAQDLHANRLNAIMFKI